MPDRPLSDDQRIAVKDAREAVVRTVRNSASVDGCAGLSAAQLQERLRQVENQIKSKLNALLRQTFGRSSEQIVGDFRESLRSRPPTQPDSLRVNLTVMDHEMTRRMHVLRRTVQLLSGPYRAEPRRIAPARGIRAKIQKLEAKGAIRIARRNYRRAAKLGQRLLRRSPAEWIERRLAGRQAAALIQRIQVRRAELEQRLLEGMGRDIYQSTMLRSGSVDTRWQAKLLNDDRLALETLEKLFLFCDQLISRTVKALNDTRREDLLLDGRPSTKERETVVAGIEQQIRRERAVLERLLHLCYPSDPRSRRERSKTTFEIPEGLPPEMQRAITMP